MLPTNTCRSSTNCGRRAWKDGAVRRDKSNRVFADPDKIHRVRHHGQRYQVDAIHLTEPSPQRTPVLYQAGSSTRGREFAATHADYFCRFHACWARTASSGTKVRRLTAGGRWIRTTGPSRGGSPLLDFAPFHGLERGRLDGFDDTLRPARCCGDDTGKRGCLTPRSPSPQCSRRAARAWPRARGENRPRAAPGFWAISSGGAGDKC
jgi:hypothetical protein